MTVEHTFATVPVAHFPLRCTSEGEGGTWPSMNGPGWADVATTHDLERELAALESRVVATVRTETRTLLLAMLSFGATVASLTYAAVRLG